MRILIVLITLVFSAQSVFGMMLFAGRPTAASGGSCSSSSSLIHQSTNSDYTRGVSTTGSTQGQSFTISTTTDLAKITVDMSHYEDAEFTLRIHSSADLSSYTEELSGSYTGTAAQVVEFESSTNPELTAGTWYFGIRVSSGTDSDGWFRGSNTSVYTGGTVREGDGGTTDWDMSESNTSLDLGFEVFECD